MMVVNARSGAHCPANITHLSIQTHSYRIQKITYTRQFIKPFLSIVTHVIFVKNNKLYMDENEFSPLYTKIYFKFIFLPDFEQQAEM